MTSLEYYLMPSCKRHIPCHSSAVMKCCRVCNRTKHISAFTRTVMNYCQSICNTCSTTQIVDNHLKKHYSESESPRSWYNEYESRNIDHSSYPFVVPYAKWITVKCFGDSSDCGDHIVVAKVVN